MQLAKVIGNTTATVKDPTLVGAKLLVVQPWLTDGTTPDGRMLDGTTPDGRMRERETRGETMSGRAMPAYRLQRSATA